MTAAELAETSCNSSERCAPLPFSASTHYLVKFYSSPFLSFFLYFFWPSGAAGGIIAPRPESEPVPLAVENESEVAQSCPTLCDPVDCSPPGSSVHGLLQARALEWVAIPLSRGS